MNSPLKKRDKLRMAEEMIRIHGNFQLLGKSLIYGSPKGTRDHKKLFAKTMQSSLNLWSIYESIGIRGRMRIPSVKLVSGAHTDVIQKENGIIYKLDPETVMFSKGNKNERHRLANEVVKDETVLDMFSGIGYFAIPVSFHVKRVYAAELNPVSFHYLLMNIVLNKASNVVPMFGDCSKIPLQGFADRIIMGHFDSAKYYEKALTYMRDEGKMHIHHLVTRDNFGAEREKFLSYKGVEEISMHVVKGYSPGKDHVVIDLTVKKN